MSKDSRQGSIWLQQGESERAKAWVLRVTEERKRGIIDWFIVALFQGSLFGKVVGLSDYS